MYKRFKRVFLVVIDSLGVGAMPDAEEYGDVGSDTLGHIAASADKLHIPNLVKLGIANLHELDRIKPADEPLAYYCKMREKSRGKDTMTGHWEMMGVHTSQPFKTFSEHGFPAELIKQLEQQTGREIVGNRSSSGTEIIEELAEQEIEGGKLIVYTSADSVLQICGHEETLGLDELYRYCEIARELCMKDEWKVGRVIARPYKGQRESGFTRTSNRHDYALKPPVQTTLDVLKENGYSCISVGKINDIFDGEGITEAHTSDSSIHGIEKTIELAKREFEGVCFVNLVDFDALWGHRRDVAGYARELRHFDERLGMLIAELKEDDLLLITADHGNDPTYKGTDHTREKVPFLAYSPSFNGGGELIEQDTFAVIGATIADNFGVMMPESALGHSVLDYLK